MRWKRLRFRSIRIACIIALAAMMSIGISYASPVEVKVTIADHFRAVPTPGGPLGVRFPATLELQTDGLAGGVALVPGGLGKLGTPDFTLAGFSSLFSSPLPSDWPTHAALLFGGAFEFHVDSITGNAASILAGVVQQVTVESNDLVINVGGLQVTPVDFHFSTLVTLPELLGDSDGWIPGSGEFFGVPFNGWAAGFTTASGQGMFGVVTTGAGGVAGRLQKLLGGKRQSLLFGEIQGGTATFRAAPVPEPGSLMLLGVGIIGLFYIGYRRRKPAA